MNTTCNLQESEIRNLAKTNPVVMELELFSKGLRIDGSVRLEGKRSPLRLRAGLGSGLEAMIHGIDDWRGDYITVNIPIHGAFVKDSPYLLVQEEERYFVTANGEKIRQIFLFPLPKFYNEKTSDGILMSRIGCIFGNVGSMMLKGCQFWDMEGDMKCGFCATGLYRGDTEEPEKTIRQVVEVCKKMVFEEKVDSLHFNTGFRKGKAIEEIIPFVEAVHRETGAYICVQCPPEDDFSLYEKLYEAGARHVSFCFEIFNLEHFRSVCPGKSKYIKHDRFFEAIRHCVGIFPDVAGELVMGLEPVRNTLDGIEKVTGLGAWPTVTVFRPLPGTRMGEMRPPSTRELIPVVKRMYTSCMEKGVPLEQLPQIRESLSPLPMDGKYLLDF
ncbi:MAG: radical SAM protein [bacterium]